MGYTHYWNLKQIPQNYEAQKAKAFIEVQALLERLPEFSESAGGCYNDHKIKLCGGMGTGKPEITKEKIWFNGDGKQNLDHETFHFDFTSNTPLDFDFCKTARKPYDMAVCITLLSLANHIDGFSFSSDGDLEDWKPAIDLYNKYSTNISENLKKSVSSL